MEYRIAVIAGDGIGPEVTREATKVLTAAADRFGFTFRTTVYPWSGEHFLKTGVLMPESALGEYRDHDAVLLGAIGDPRMETGLLERAVVAGCRFGLDLYVNLRPIKLYAPHLCPLKNDKPENIDMVIIRENTEDLYVGTHGFFKKGTPDEVATQELLLTRKGTERVIRYAFEVAKGRRRKKLTMVDKANAVRAYDLWTRTFEEVGKEYPGIEQDHAYVDACTMWLVKNPEWFDTVVVPNMFGDIITDLGAMIQGGMGAAASGNIHPGQTSMFEPIHGSAPKYTGKNVANPVAAVASVQMLLDFLGEKDAAAAVEESIAGNLRSKKIPALTANCGLSTSQIGDLLAASVRG